MLRYRWGIACHQWITGSDAEKTEWRTVGYSWFEALDSDSYKLWDDAETRGTLWCLDPGCSNYYRYFERLLVRRCRGARGVDFYKQ